MMRNLLIRIQIVPGMSSAVWCYLFGFFDTWKLRNWNQASENMFAA